MLYCLFTIFEFYNRIIILWLKLYICTYTYLLWTIKYPQILLLPIIIIILEDTYFLISLYFSMYFHIYIYLGLISIFDKYNLPYIFVSKGCFVFTHVICPNYLQCPLYIFLNTFASLHDSFLISVFHDYSLYICINMDTLSLLKAFIPI